MNGMYTNGMQKNVKLNMILEEWHVKLKLVYEEQNTEDWNVDLD